MAIQHPITRTRSATRASTATRPKARSGGAGQEREECISGATTQTAGRGWEGKKPRGGNTTTVKKGKRIRPQEDQGAGENLTEVEGGTKPIMEAREDKQEMYVQRDQGESEKGKGGQGEEEQDRS